MRGYFVLHRETDGVFQIFSWSSRIGAKRRTVRHVWRRTVGVVQTDFGERFGKIHGRVHSRREFGE